GFQIEADQLLDDGSDLGPIVSAGDVSADGRENIAAMEGGGNFGADHPIGVGDLANAFDAIVVLDHGHQAVVGQHEELPALRFRDHSPARTADAGIDDRHEYCSGREVGRGAEEEASAVSNRKSIYLVGEIDNAEMGCDAIHDALAEGHRIVRDAEIGHEDYGWRRFDGRLLRHERARDEE